MSKLKIAILGNKNESYRPHYLMDKVFREFNATYDTDFEWVATETLVEDAAEILGGYSGIVAGSGPYKSKEGVINGIRFARENNIPFFGTCSGFGYAVLEFGQSLFHLDSVFHPYEKDDLNDNEVFLQQLTFCSSEMHVINFKPAARTLTEKIYAPASVVYEQSHCTYGISTKMIDAFEKQGFIVSGVDQAGEAKIMEYTKNGFFVIILFMPQAQSTPELPHPLLSAFFKAVTEKAINRV